jgi:septum formation protein
MSRRLKIVLASASPRRRELMGRLGIPFEAVDPGDIDEATEGRPEDVVRRNSLAKARRVADRLVDGIVVGADTVVVKDEEILGKPSSPSEAGEMLRSLAGSVHRVLTGLTVMDAGSGRVRSEVVETLVRMLPLSEDEIMAYISTGEPMGKAGGYAIQGLGGILVEGIQGCYYNVVGLPISKLSSILRDFDVRIMATL